MVNLLSNYGPYSTDAVFRDAIYFIKDDNNCGCLIETIEKERQIAVYTGNSEMEKSIGAEVFDKFLELSKKATLHISVDAGANWVDCKGLKKDVLDNRDLKTITGNWINDKSAFDDSLPQKYP